MPITPKIHTLPVFALCQCQCEKYTVDCVCIIHYPVIPGLVFSEERAFVLRITGCRTNVLSVQRDISRAIGSSE